MTDITINKGTIETGVNQTLASIRANYPDSEAVRNAIISNGYMGLNVSPDVKNVVDARIEQSTISDRFFDNLGDASVGAAWDAGYGVTESLLASQKDLAITLTRETKALIAQGYTVKQALVQITEGGQTKLYVDKVKGVVVRSETILSETTHIPLGKILSGAGTALGYYGVYESLKKPIGDAYAATTGSGSTIEAEKSYIVAASGVLAAGAAAGVLAGAATPTLAILAGSAIAGMFATTAVKTALDSLPQIIDAAKATGQTLEQVYEQASALVAEKLDAAYNATGAAAQALLDDAEGYINDFADGIGQLADDYGWAWDNPDAILGELPAWLPFVNGLRDGNGFLGTSPLVLDLDGDGVEASNLGWGAAGSHVYFDMDNDGFAERTAWAAGILRYGKNTRPILFHS